MQGQHPNAGYCLLSSGKSDQADNSGMGHSPRQGKLAKILVEGNQDTFLAVRMGKNLSIAGITVPLPTPDDVMTCFTQGLKDTAPDAGVE